MTISATTPAAEAAALDAEEERRQRQIEKNQAAIALLDEWSNETDPEVIREQRETWEYLKRALDEHRTHRKLFP